MPLLGTRGAASAKAFGLTAGGASYYPYVGGTIAFLGTSQTYLLQTTCLAVDTDGTFYIGGATVINSSTYYMSVWKYSKNGVALPFVYSNSSSFSYVKTIGVDSSYVYVVTNDGTIKILNKSNLSEVSSGRVAALTSGPEISSGTNLVQTSGSNLFFLNIDAAWGKVPTNFAGTPVQYYLTDSSGTYPYVRGHNVNVKNGKVYMACTVGSSYNLFFQIDIATNTVSNMFSGANFLGTYDYAGSGSVNTVSVTGDSNYLWVGVSSYAVYGKGFLLYKFNRSATPSASLIWAKEYYYGYLSASYMCMDTDSSGNAYMATAYNTYVQVIKIDPNGNHLWTRRITNNTPSTGFGYPLQMQVTDSYVLVTTYNEYGNFGIFFVKLEPLSGIPLQTVTLNGYSVVVTAPSVTVNNTTLTILNLGGFYAASQNSSYLSPTALTLSSNFYYNSNPVTPLAAV